MSWFKVFPSWKQDVSGSSDAKKGIFAGFVAWGAFCSLFQHGRRSTVYVTAPRYDMEYFDPPSVSSGAVDVYHVWLQAKGKSYLSDILQSGEIEVLLNWQSYFADSSPQVH